MKKLKILVVDDDPTVLGLIRAILEEEGLDVVCQQDGVKAREQIQQEQFALLITDMLMRPVGGLELLSLARKVRPQMPTILVTGHATIETAVSAMKEGAFDYVTKPFTMQELMASVAPALKLSVALHENADLKAQLGAVKTAGPLIIAESPLMLRVVGQLPRIAATDAAVVIQGESGSGKELLARAIHLQSPRRDHPFVAVNCAAIPENLLESELFGHAKGSFTGAVSAKAGLFEVAAGGTLFLDEISSLPVSLQGKILRVLQDGEFRRVGETDTRKANVRILSATHHNLEDMIRAGQFREDLYYRLAVIPLLVPPLRERREDILPIAQHVMRRELGPDSKLPVIEPEAQLLLEQYDWPGNVRELENAIRHALAFHEGTISASVLPARITRRPGSAQASSTHPAGAPVNLAAPRNPGGSSLKSFLRSVEKEYIARVLRDMEGDKEKTAALLKVSLATLYRKLPEAD